MFANCNIFLTFVIYFLHNLYHLKHFIMKTNYLLPHKIKKIGWIILIPGLVLGFSLLTSDFEYPKFNVKMYSILDNSSFFNSNKSHIVDTNIINEIAILFILVGGVSVAFSKEKVEDEYIKTIRLNSLLWATIINYLILFLANLLLFDFNFLNFMALNMFAVLLLFIIKFKIELYKFKKK